MFLHVSQRIGFVYFQTFLDLVAKWIPQILVESPGPSSLCWQLLATVQMNAKGMICLFFIEIVSHPPSRLIHPQESPNALIPRGNNFFFLYNLLSNDLLIVASTLTENYRSFLGNQIFTPFMSVYVAQVSRDSVRGNWLWGAAVCESLRCHSSAANGMPNGCPCDSLPLSL